MGWKLIKEHYRIGHLVSFHADKGLCIGSSYVHNLIVLNPEAKTINVGKRAISGNADLTRYYEEMTGDREKLWAMLEQPDTFERDLPVFTYEGGEVVQYLCESYGWPNVTHDGQMMYDNRFFKRRDEALKAGLRKAKARVGGLTETVARAARELAEREQWLAEAKADLARLEATS